MRWPSILQGCVAVVLTGLLWTGCGGAQDEPLVASSATQAGYAQRYPEALADTQAEISKREEEVRAVLEEVPSYPGQLTSPNWHQVLDVIEEAEVAGRSAAYSDRVREVRHVHTFFEAEQKEIGMRAGGAAQYAANQQGCNAQIGGVVSSALEKAVERQLEKRLRERNEAHQTLERYRVSLGEANADKLATQADRLSYASFVIHVEIEELRSRLQSMVDEAEQVKKTLDEAIAEERAFQGEAGRKDEEKAASEVRVEAMQRSKSALDASVQQGKTALESLKDRIEKLRKDYDYIVGALLTELRQRAGEKQ